MTAKTNPANTLPVLFNGDMVRAIIAGRKTQTRRPVVGKNPFDAKQLWVRENYHLCKEDDAIKPSECKHRRIWYAATSQAMDGHDVGKLRPSILMPRWASRITLEVIKTRQENLRDISILDALAEGVEPEPCGPCCQRFGPVGCGECMNTGFGENPIDTFAHLWNGIYSEGNGNLESWAINPKVWVAEFRVHSIRVGGVL